MPFIHQGYSVTWTPYCESIITVEEGQTRQQAMEGTLEYLVEKLIEKYPEPNTRAACVLTKLALVKIPPELAALIDTNAKVVCFGTESEIQTTLDKLEGN